MAELGVPMCFSKSARLNWTHWTSFTSEYQMFFPAWLALTAAAVREPMYARTTKAPYQRNQSD